MSRVLSMFRGEKPPERRFRRGAYLLPSLFTVANMFCGWACIVFAMRGDYVTAAPFIGFAIVLDGLDGRVARATGATSDFGVEFDSLADVISFGVAPATLVFAWGLEPLGRVGWAVAFLWLAATAVRLARFNIQGKEGDKRYFIGLPSPAAAGVPASTVFAYPLGFVDPGAALVALPIVLLPAALMVSRLRFRSFGALIPGRRRSYLTPLAIAAVIAATAAQPEAVLVLMAYSYLASGLIGAAMSRGQRPPTRRPVPAEPAVPAAERSAS
jgi:CDP-diacylglycerol--serine O-phosphatidyltransferase